MYFFVRSSGLIFFRKRRMELLSWGPKPLKIQLTHSPAHVERVRVGAAANLSISRPYPEIECTDKKYGQRVDSLRALYWHLWHQLLCVMIFVGKITELLRILIQNPESPPQNSKAVKPAENGSLLNTLIPEVLFIYWEGAIPFVESNRIKVQPVGEMKKAATFPAPIFNEYIKSPRKAIFAGTGDLMFRRRAQLQTV